MKFLDVEYLSKLEEETFSNIDFWLSSIGGGSTLFFAFIFLIFVSVLILIKNETNFISFVEEKLERIERHRIQKKALRKFVKGFNSKKEDNVFSSVINSNETYKELLRDFSNAKVNGVFLLLVALIYPLYFVVKIIADIEDFFEFSIFEITLVFSVVLLVSSGFVGMVNEEKKYSSFEVVAAEEFIPASKAVEYPVVHQIKTEDGFELFFVSGHKVRKVEYNGEVKLDSNLSVDNNILGDKVIVLDSDVKLDESLMPFTEVIGYVYINSYSSSIKEYNQFVKENSKFLKESEFESFLKNSFDEINHSEVSEVILIKH